MRNPDSGRVLRAGAADRARDALAPRAPVEHVARAPRDRQRHHPIGFATWLSNHRSFGLEWPEPERGSPARAFFAPSSCPNGSAASVEATGQRLHGSGPARWPPRRQSWSGKAMFLNALEYDDAAKSIIKSRAEPSRAEPSRAEPSRALFMSAGARHASAERKPVRLAAWLPSFRTPRGAVRPSSDSSPRRRASTEAS